MEYFTVTYKFCLQVTMSLRRVIIATKKAPDAIGPYNQAVQVTTLIIRPRNTKRILIGWFL